MVVGGGGGGVINSSSGGGSSSSSSSTVCGILGFSVFGFKNFREGLSGFWGSYSFFCRASEFQSVKDLQNGLRLHGVAVSGL